MIEIEHIPELEKDKPVESTANGDEATGTESSSKTPSKSTEEPTQRTGEASKEDSLQDRLKDHTTNPRDLQSGDVFYGSIKYNTDNGKQASQQGIFMVISSTVKGKKGQSREFTLMDAQGNSMKICSGAIKISNISSEKKMKEIIKKAIDKFGNEEDAKEMLEEKKKELEKRKEAKAEAERIKALQFSFNSLEPEQKLKKLIEAGMNNIWMVGPAGCGKSTIARNTAKELDIPYLCISCGIGTSATEFTGYKYPTREATKFSEFYAKKSIILIDEMTALDPSVAQVINAALANGEIETTTGTVLRHPECIIIATSNTFGNGADRQYVANNQLDASTIDRFTGAIIEVNYSEKYESQFDEEVVNYVKNLRNCIKRNSMRRIASTRMIQSAEKMKKIGMTDWKEMLIINWSDTEKHIVTDYFKTKETIASIKDLNFTNNPWSIITRRAA